MSATALVQCAQLNAAITFIRTMTAYTRVIVDDKRYNPRTIMWPGKA